MAHGAPSREQRSAEDGLGADVVVGRQDQDPGVSIPAEHDVEDRQEDARCRAPIAGLDNDVLRGEVRERLLPVAPVILGDDHEDPRPGNDRGGAAQGPAQRGSSLPNAQYCFGTDSPATPRVSADTR